MNISDMPIIEYLRLCLKTAEHRGFLWVMVLLARERDIPNGYADIKRYWNSYDDLTGDKILFLLTTSNNPDEHTEIILIHEKERYNRIGSSNLLIVNNKPLHISEEDFPANAEDYWIREEALRNTSLHISPILRKYRLSERDIPAILLIPTMEHSSPVIIRGINDVYSSLRSLIIYLEPLLREFDDCKLIMANKDNEIADTVNAIQANNQMITDKRIQKYLQSKEYVGNFMKGMDSDSRESLKSAIDNRDLSVCARFEQPLRAHLNRLIDMQPQIGEIEFDSQTYAARNAELSEKKKRLECEHEELGNNLFALRKKIYETAGEYCKGLLNMNTKNTNLCGKSQLIDVLIMVATVEEENAILQDVGWEYQYTAKGYGYYHRKEGLSFAVARAAEMGEIPAAVAAQHYVEQLKPRFLSMAGFCAGREGSVNLGDVFVPIKIYDYDNGGKQLTEDTVLPEMNLTQLDPIWRQKIERFGSEWRDTISITKPVPYEQQFIGLLKILIENNYSIRLDSLKKAFHNIRILIRLLPRKKIVAS